MQCVHGPCYLILPCSLYIPLDTVYISDVLPAGEAPSQELEEAWEVSEGHPTQTGGWKVWWSGSEQ